MKKNLLNLRHSAPVRKNESEADTSADGLLQSQIELEREIQLIARRAVWNHALYVEYYPVYDLATKRFVGAEALSRFAEGTPPELWLNGADRIELGTSLEITAVGKALEVIHLLPEDAWLSVNVTSGTLSSGVLTDFLLNYPNEKILIELSECAERCDPAGLIDHADVLRARGARLAIDGFGAGFWTLHEMLELRPDFIKLHRSLVIGISNDDRRRRLIRALVRFSKETETKIVAGGIERTSDLGALSSLGVHYGQGSVISVPVDFGMLPSILMGIEGPRII